MRSPWWNFGVGSFNLLVALFLYSQGGSTFYVKANLFFWGLNWALALLIAEEKKDGHQTR